jgi:hypothetical protein
MTPRLATVLAVRIPSHVLAESKAVIAKHWRTFAVEAQSTPFSAFIRLREDEPYTMLWERNILSTISYYADILVWVVQ